MTHTDFVDNAAAMRHFQKEYAAKFSNMARRAKERYEHWIDSALVEHPRTNDSLIEAVRALRQNQTQLTHRSWMTKSIFASCEAKVDDLLSKLKPSSETPSLF